MSTIGIHIPKSKESLLGPEATTQHDDQEDQGSYQGRMYT